MRIFTNSEDKVNRSTGKEIQFHFEYYNRIPLCKMDYLNFIISNQNEESISIQRIKTCTLCIQTI